MKTIALILIGVLSMLAAQATLAGCRGDYTECKDDALSDKNDCLGMCDVDDDDCKTDCRKSYRSTLSDCQGTLNDCLAALNPGPDYPPVAAPGYPIRSGPIYTPPPSVPTQPVYDPRLRQQGPFQPPVQTAPPPSQPFNTPTKCPFGAYIYEQDPHTGRTVKVAVVRAPNGVVVSKVPVPPGC